MTDIFTTDTPAPVDSTTTTPQEPQAQPSAADQLLKSIVTEQGAPKYSSVEEGIKALIASQNHIKTIEADNAALRNEVANKKAIEEMIAALKTQKDEPASQQASPKTTEVDIEAQIEQVIQRKAEKDRQEANLNLIRERVSKAFGEKASEVFYQKAAELGLDKAGINSLAASSPTAVLKLLGLEGVGPKVDTPTTSTINTANFQHTSEVKKSGMSYEKGALMDSWQRIKKEVAKANNL